MTHIWKIGDWCETDSGDRGFVVNITRSGTPLVYFADDDETNVASVKPLPLCDSWDWQPPSPPDPGEGYRAIDPMVDKPQEGDEYWSPPNRSWQERSITFSRNTYQSGVFYRRKLPTYAPFTAETFKPHRDRWIRWEGHAGAFQINNYDESGYLVGTDRYPWSFLLEYGYTFDDTNTPCGVPQRQNHSPSIATKCVPSSAPHGTAST